ncbi:hypothetical protein PFISCL1PPCAC_9307, partial [Pristionchus fissidentatus]
YMRLELLPLAVHLAANDIAVNIRKTTSCLIQMERFIEIHIQSFTTRRQIPAPLEMFHPLPLHPWWDVTYDCRQDYCNNLN